MERRGGIEQHTRLDGQRGAQRKAAVALGETRPVDSQFSLMVIDLLDNVLDYLVVGGTRDELVRGILALDDGNAAVLLDQFGIVISPCDVRFGLVPVQRGQVPFIVGAVVDRIAVHAHHVLAFAVGCVVKEKIGGTDPFVAVGIKIRNRVEVGVDDPLVEIAGIALHFGLLCLVGRRCEKIGVERSITGSNRGVESIAEFPQRTECRLDRLPRFVLVETGVEEIAASGTGRDSSRQQERLGYESEFHNGFDSLIRK